MSYDILGDFGDTQALFDAAAVRGADQSFVSPVWDGTVDLSAADVFTQVPAQQGAGKLDNFWQGIGTNLLGYAIAKDAAKSGLTRPGGTAQAGGAVPKTQTGKGVSPLLLIGGAVVALAAVWFVAKQS